MALLQIPFVHTWSQTDLKQKSISGNVTDKAGNPLLGVSVYVKGTTIGTATDETGKFSLILPADALILTFSFAGMTPRELEIGDQTMLNVQMEESVQSLDEVVIVGYGVQKKVNLTGAVSAVKFDETVSSRPVLNVSTALQGLASGIFQRQYSGWPGRGDGTSIYIRGTGTLNTSYSYPLIIVDGIEASLDLVNPRDIESVSVLKDAASASIYGSRSANGVIVVTTRKGAGKKLNLNYNGIFSLSQPSKLLEYVSDYATYMRLMNESARNVGSSEIFSSSTITAWEHARLYPDSLSGNGIPYYVIYPNTSWNRVMYRNRWTSDQNLSVSGSTQNTNFYISADYLNNPGLVENTGIQDFRLRLNLETDVSKWLKVGTTTYGNLADLGMGDYNALYFYIYQTTPGVYPEYKGMYGQPEAPEEKTSVSNPIYRLRDKPGDYKALTINTTLFSKISFAKGLTWDIKFNYRKSFQDQYYRDNPNKLRIKFSSGEEFGIKSPPEELQTYSWFMTLYSYTFESLLHYQASLAKRHNINALLGYDEYYYFYRTQSATKKALFDESVYVFDAASEMISIGGSNTDNARRSIFGRINYDYNGKYLLEANLRYDGSSRFNSDNRYGLFPSISAGWRISREDFLKNSDLIQNLKLRASWGKLGNCATGDYDYQATYGPVYYSFNSDPGSTSQVTGLTAKKIANSKLRWETTTIANAGIDVSLFRNRLSAEFDAYKKITKDILTTLPIYMTLGTISAPTVNSASVSNKGLELTLGWNDKVGQLKYALSFNFGYNKNKVTKYKGKLIQEWRIDTAGNKYYYTNLGDISSGSQNRILEDYIINEHFLYELYKGNGTYFNADSTVNIIGGPKDGMIRTPDDLSWLQAMVAAGYKFMPDQTLSRANIWYGDYIYADLNGDKIYGNTYDRRFAGESSMPKISFGSQLNLSWKKFDLSLTWYGLAGYKLYWKETSYNSTNTNYGYQIGKLISEDHYYYNDSNPEDSTNNVTALYPRLKYNINDTQNTLASARWLYDGSFVKLKNITLGYTIPERISQRLFTEQIRIYLSLENLFTITSFPGLDPEMGSMNTGSANTNYPIMRQVAFGVNIIF